MFSFLKRRWFLLLIGFVLMAVFVWFAGPYFAFADYHPLEPVIVRLVVIALVVAVWLGSVLVKRIRAARASAKIAAAVVKSAEGDRPSADAQKLRDAFEEAVAKLQEDHRKSGRSLYDLPWYVIIGAPGSGKTTALVNSGLKLSLEQKTGKEALRGVGGTRNCDWLFTDEAVFLDTAGRYFTQDSDAASDSAGWTEFLGLLRQHRGRRPINGVILTISAQDMMVLNEEDKEKYVEAARRRLRELNKELQIQLPVYVLVTKCDLVAGFTEYFSDSSQETRAQVWGVTFPYEQTLDSSAARAFPAEFDTLMGRLNARVFARVEDERDPRRRTTMFAFPQQLAALRDPLTHFVDEAFVPSRTEQPVLLRGVYFTSGTQEGTPIDRLLGAIGRRFGVAGEAVAQPTGRGKAYFVERLLKEVLIGESGLAGVNRKVEARKAAIQLGAYAAMGLIAVVGIIGLSVSYSRNRAYVADVTAAVSSLTPSAAIQPTAPIETLLPHLDAVRAVVDSANRYEAAPPWSMRWGLYQGASVGHAARDAYLREVNSIVLPQFAARLKDSLVSSAREPETLYEFLKAYLMLGGPQHLDKKHLQFAAELEWNAGTRTAALAKHFQSLLDYSEALRPFPLDQALIAQARSTVRQASVPRIMYGRIKRSYSTDTARAVRLDQGAGLVAEQVLRRKSGISLSEPVPAVYSKAVFNEVVTGRGMVDLVQKLKEDDWVAGGDMSVANSARLAGDVIDVYERDYIATWDGILADLEIKTFPTVAQTADALGTLSGPTSPLRGMLGVVAENTTLVAPPGEKAPAPGAISAAAGAFASRLGQLAKSAQQATGIPTGQAGALVTAHFQPVQRLLVGAPGSAPIDVILGQLSQIQQQLKALGPDVGGTNPIQALSTPTLRGQLQSLQEISATLPPGVGGLIAQIGHRTKVSLESTASNDLERRYQQQVLATCANVVAGHYPFDSASQKDVLLEDFKQVFGRGGLYDKFFADNHLEKLVDDQRSPWTWRPGVESLSRSMLAQFEAAQRLRDVFFGRGGDVPQVGFAVTLTDVDVAASRFVLQIDGQVADGRPGTPKKTPMHWPGPGAAAGMAAATFEDVAGPWPPTRFDGPWAWFRLIDAGQIQRESDQRAVLTFQNSSHRARVIIEPDSIRNPFSNRDWLRFSCGS